jgi:protease II
VWSAKLMVLWSSYMRGRRRHKKATQPDFVNGAAWLGESDFSAQNGGSSAIGGGSAVFILACDRSS